MSVCEPLKECRLGKDDECLALRDTYNEHGHEFYCAMRGGRKGFPDTCPHAPALRAVVEDKEKALVPVSKEDIDIVSIDEGFELVAVPMGTSRGPSAEAIEQVNENPELVLVAAKTCPGCRGEGRVLEPSPMPGIPHRSTYITCNTCRGMGLVMVDLDLEAEETGGGE